MTVLRSPVLSEIQTDIASLNIGRERIPHVRVKGISGKAVAVPRRGINAMRTTRSRRFTTANVIDVSANPLRSGYTEPPGCRANTLLQPNIILRYNLPHTATPISFVTVQALRLTLYFESSSRIGRRSVAGSSAEPFRFSLDSRVVNLIHQGKGPALFS